MKSIINYIFEKFKISKDIYNNEYDDIFTLICFDTFSKEYIEDIKKVIIKWFSENNVLNYKLLVPKPVDNFPWDSIKFINKHSDNWDYEYFYNYSKLYTVDEDEYNIFEKNTPKGIISINANNKMIYLRTNTITFTIIKKDEKN